MDLERFDALTRLLARKESRRKAIKSLLAGAGGAGALAVSDVSAARKVKSDCCPTTLPSLCGATCTDTNTDPANCGACGTACSASQTCTAGLCTNLPAECSTATECPGQDTECQTRTCTEGRCGFSFEPAGTPTTVQTIGDCKENVCDGSVGLTTQNDDSDVFDSNNECVIDYCSSGNPATIPSPPGSRCAQGGGTYCNGSGECVECVEPSDCPDRPNSTSHCGAGGFCSIECNFGYTSCDASTENGCEVHLLSDPEHCGSCPNRCAVPANGAATCIQGSCGITCDPGFTASGDATTCTPDTPTTTTAGPTTTTAAPATTTTAGPVCVNDGDCDANATCVNTSGGFDCVCNTGYTGDGFSCEDIDECASAELNECDANATCSNSSGGYTCTCNDGFGGDGVTCTPDAPTTTTVPPCASDPRVGSSCDTGHLGVCRDGTLQCVGGQLQCVAAIQPGSQQEICDGLDNDCDGFTDEDFNFQTDVNHCGGCNQVCQLDHATASCAGGQCAIASCDAGFFDCDGDATNGCETMQDAFHCGGCFTVCGVDETCVSGRCGSLTICETATDCGEDECKVWSCDNSQCIVTYAPGGTSCMNEQGQASECDNSGTCLPTFG